MREAGWLPGHPPAARFSEELRALGPVLRHRGHAAVPGGRGAAAHGGLSPTSTPLLPLRVTPLPPPEPSHNGVIFCEGFKAGEKKKKKTHTNPISASLRISGLSVTSLLDKRQLLFFIFLKRARLIKRISQKQVSRALLFVSSSHFSPTAQQPKKQLISRPRPWP